MNDGEPATPAPAIPSGTVAVVRDGDGAGIEVLMLRRARSERDRFSGMWVFPGGKVDEADRAESADERVAAMVAAVRECREEAGIELPPDSVHPIARWEPEPTDGVLRRFAAWVFIAPATRGVVAIDGTEIHDHEWMRPSDALARQAAGGMELAPPTWVILHQLSAHETTAAALAWVRSREPEHFLTRLTRVDEQPVALWHGDEWYDGTPGGVHRLWLVPGAWRYERSPT